MFASKLEQREMPRRAELRKQSVNNDSQILRSLSRFYSSRRLWRSVQEVPFSNSKQSQNTTLRQHVWMWQTYQWCIPSDQSHIGPTVPVDRGHNWSHHIWHLVLVQWPGLRYLWNSNTTDQDVISTANGMIWTWACTGAENSKRKVNIRSQHLTRACRNECLPLHIEQSFWHHAETFYILIPVPPVLLTTYICRLCTWLTACSFYVVFMRNDQQFNVPCFVQVCSIKFILDNCHGRFLEHVLIFLFRSLFNVYWQPRTCHMPKQEPFWLDTWKSCPCGFWFSREWWPEFCFQVSWMNVGIKRQHDIARLFDVFCMESFFEGWSLTKLNLFPFLFRHRWLRGTCNLRKSLQHWQWMYQHCISNVSSWADAHWCVYKLFLFSHNGASYRDARRLLCFMNLWERTTRILYPSFQVCEESCWLSWWPLWCRRWRPYSTRAPPFSR